MRSLLYNRICIKQIFLFSLQRDVCAQQVRKNVCYGEDDNHECLDKKSIERELGEDSVILQEIIEFER